MTSAREIRRVSRGTEGRKRRPLSFYYSVVVLAVLALAEVIGVLGAPRRGVSGGSEASAATESLWRAASSLASDRPVAHLASLGLLTGALLVLQLARYLGPISLSLPRLHWWLPLPVSRRALLRPSCLRTVGATAVVSGSLTGLLLGGIRGLDQAASTVAASVGVAGACVLIVGAAMLLQQFPRVGRCADTVLAAAIPVIMLGLIALAAGSGESPTAARLPKSLITLSSYGAAWPLALLLPAAAAAALMYLGLPRLTTAQLRLAGTRLSSLAAGVVSLHGGGFAVIPERPPRARDLRRRPGRLVSGPRKRFVVTQLRVWWRWPGQLSRACFFGCLPAAVILLPALDSIAVLAAVLVLSALRMATISGSVVGLAQANPTLARLLPVSRREQGYLSSVLPLLVLVPWCVGSWGLLAVLGAAPQHWAALAVPLGVGLAGAALRTGTRPDPDWASPVIASPMGALPLSVLLNALRGRALTVIVMIPALVALYLGTVTGFGLVCQTVLGLAAWLWATFTPKW